MGCVPSSAIVIDLDRKNPVFFAGEIVSGTVHLSIITEKLEADEIAVKLIGQAGYTTSQKHTDNGHRTTRTVYHDISFLSLKQVLIRPEPGQRQVTLMKGKNSWSFQVQIPEQVLPTIGQPHAYPYVQYYVQVLIDKVWYKLNRAENRYITVIPRITILQKQPYCNPTIFGNHNRKDIVLKGTLNKLTYVPGETIQVTMEVENQRQAFIQQVAVIMINVVAIGPCISEFILLNHILPEMMRRNEAQIVQTCEIQVPLGLMTPSCQFYGSLEQAVMVNVNYMLRFDVKVDGIFNDFNTIVPIIIATDSNSNFSLSQI